MVAVVVAAWDRPMRASAAFPLRVLAASCCSCSNILLWNSLHLVSLSPCRIRLTCSVVMVLGVLLAAAASVLSCWDGHQTLLLSSDPVLTFSSQSSGLYSSVCSCLPVMFEILLFGVVWEGIVGMKGTVVEVARLTVRCCVVVLGSTGVLLEWSVYQRDC